MNNIIKLMPFSNYDKILELVDEDMWTKHTWRQDAENSCHKATESIFLRVPTTITPDSVFDEIEAKCTPLVYERTEFADMMRMLMFNLAAAELGRVMLIKLKAGGVIDRHADEGLYPQYYRRYHLPLVTSEDVVFEVDGEEANMQKGFIYWIDNKKDHSVQNNSKEDRIHLVFDAKPLLDIPYL